MSDCGGQACSLGSFALRKPAATLEDTQESLWGEVRVRRDPHGGDLRPPPTASQHQHGQWVRHLGSGPQAPVQPSDAVAPADTLTGTVRPSQNH